MITYLRVRNLAIVEELAIEPGAGLNVLTGETGAGKSLLIDSLEFLSGARGSAELVRHGADKMYAEAALSLPSAFAQELEQSGIEAESAEHGVELIVRREMSANGRGRVLANGSIVTVRELAPLMERALEIHGQDESRGRVAGRTHLEMLDEFSANAELLASARAAFAAWRGAADELEEHQAANRDRALRVDLLRYQIDELTAAGLRDGEEEELRAERAVLANAEEMIGAAASAHTLLEEDEFSANTQLARAAQQLASLARKVEELRQLHDEIEELRVRGREAARSLARIADTVRHDPARLDEIEERLALIDRMKKKYGGSVGAAIEHLERVSEEFEQLANYETRLASLEQHAREKFHAFGGIATELSTRRKASVPALEEAIRTELADLAMERTDVKISVETAPAADSPLRVDGHSVVFGAEGYDRVQILIAPNRGDELRPMQKIASGGELSRLQLAIATALFRHSGRQSIATLVFDEVDVGVGGRVAEAIGKKLVRLAEQNQVICVTHLPQIAAMGTTHFRVWKEDVNGRTRAQIGRLDQRGERVEEIARMLAGEQITESARNHATELLELAHAAAPASRKRRPSARVAVD